MAVYNVYGVIGQEEDSPRHKEILDNDAKKAYTEKELNGNIASIIIEMYGDVPTVAFLQVECTNLEIGIKKYNEIKDQWKFDLQRIFWNG